MARLYDPHHWYQTGCGLVTMHSGFGSRQSSVSGTRQTVMDNGAVEAEILSCVLHVRCYYTSE